MGTIIITLTEAIVVIIIATATDILKINAEHMETIAGLTVQKITEIEILTEVTTKVTIIIIIKGMIVIITIMVVVVKSI